MSYVEMIFTGVLLTSIIIGVYFVFKEPDGDREKEDVYSLAYLGKEIKHSINQIVTTDITSLNLNKKDMESRRIMKRVLSDGVRRCSRGDIGAKEIVMSRMKYLLMNRFRITEDVIHQVIPFDNLHHLNTQDRFDILMYLQKRSGNKFMVKEIIKENQLDQIKWDGSSEYYDISKEDIDRAFWKGYQPLSYDDMLNIITQRIYQSTYGLSVVDMLIMEDQSVDGVSGGISGISYDGLALENKNGGQSTAYYQNIWIMYEGKTIHLNFLSFPNKETLIRICKNLSEHGRTGHLTSTEGGTKTHLADGSRVTIFRPYNSTQWAFFVRKFAKTSFYTLEQLITDQGASYPIELIKWGMKGCLNIIFSGDQNSGKTSNLRAAVQEIDRRQPIRTLEADFELNLNNTYENKNIVGLRPSQRLPFGKVIELLKASDAHTILFGETASLDHAKYLIELLLAGTKRVLTTGHWPRTEDMISYFVYALGAYGNSGSSEVEAMVSGLLHLDIHCVKDNDGHRYIERITEVIPKQFVDRTLCREDAHTESNLNNSTYITRDLLRYESGRYHIVGEMSERLQHMIRRHLVPQDVMLFDEFVKGWMYENPA